jgi:hypothetical protein
LADRALRGQQLRCLEMLKAAMEQAASSLAFLRPQLAAAAARLMKGHKVQEAITAVLAAAAVVALTTKAAPLRRGKAITAVLELVAVAAAAAAHQQQAERLLA